MDRQSGSGSAIGFMVQSKAVTVADYLAELTPERRADLAAVRDTIRDKLPAGCVETMQNTRRGTRRGG